MNSATPAVLLVEPQDPLNMGSVVRLCRNFGIHDVRMLAPATWDLARMAITAPHSADWIEANVRVCDDWETAVAGLSGLYGFTARHRESPVPRLAVPEVWAQLTPEVTPIGLVFGREDSGLPNDVLQRCDASVWIDTETEYSSLNLAQAVLVAVWDWRQRAARPAPFAEQPGADVRADAALVGRLFQHGRDLLDAIGFAKGSRRPEDVLAVLEPLLVRAKPSARELATLLGLVAELRRSVRAAPSGLPSNDPERPDR